MLPLEAILDDDDDDDASADECEKELTHTRHIFLTEGEGEKRQLEESAVTLMVSCYAHSRLQLATNADS